MENGLMETKGYEILTSSIDVMVEDKDCKSCVLTKVWMSPTPKGKSVRPTRKEVNTKMYVDLSGHSEEASIYHNFHYYISAVTREGYSYFYGLLLKSKVLLGLEKIFSEAGTPHTEQIDTEQIDASSATSC
jgi:hypothetical protein